MYVNLLPTTWKYSRAINNLLKLKAQVKKTRNNVVNDLDVISKILK